MKKARTIVESSYINLCKQNANVRGVNIFTFCHTNVKKSKNGVNYNCVYRFGLEGCYYWNLVASSSDEHKSTLKNCNFDKNVLVVINIDDNTNVDAMEDTLIFTITL